jgi:hypothetical protein
LTPAAANPFPEPPKAHGAHKRAVPLDYLAGLRMSATGIIAAWGCGCNKNPCRQTSIGRFANRWLTFGYRWRFRELSSGFVLAQTRNRTMALCQPVGAFEVSNLGLLN